MSRQRNTQAPEPSDMTRQEFLRITAKTVLKTARYVGYAIVLGAAGGCAMCEEACTACTSPSPGGCTSCTNYCTGCVSCTSGCLANTF